MSVKEITSSSEYKNVITQSGLVVVDFKANWCFPCNKIAPKVAELAIAYPSAHFYKVDVDKLQDVAASTGVTSMPTFLFFKDGKHIDTVVGANLSILKKKVDLYA